MHRRKGKGKGKGVGLYNRHRGGKAQFTMARDNGQSQIYSVLVYISVYVPDSPNPKRHLDILRRVLKNALDISVWHSLEERAFIPQPAFLGTNRR